MSDDDLKRAIILLVKEGVLTWEGLLRIVYDISSRGAGRGRIVALFTSIMNDADAALTGEDLDFLGDFSLHLIGQCNAADIVRLAGDPEDIGELADCVCSGRWKTGGSAHPGER